MDTSKNIRNKIKEISKRLVGGYGGEVIFLESVDGEIRNWDTDKDEKRFVDSILQVFKEHIDKEIIGKNEKLRWTADFMEEGANELRYKQRQKLQKLKEEL